MGVRIVRTPDDVLNKDNVTLSEILKRSEGFDQVDRDMILKDIISIIVSSLNLVMDTDTIIKVRDMVFRYAKPYIQTKDDTYLVMMYKLLISKFDRDTSILIYDNVTAILYQ